MVVEVVSACYLNMLLAINKKLYDLDTDGMNAALSLESSIMWVGIILLTPEVLHD